MRAYGGTFGDGRSSVTRRIRTKERAWKWAAKRCDRLEQHGQEIPARLERLRKSGLKKLSRTDPDSRFLRERGGFTLGYTGTLAVSEDHCDCGTVCDTGNQRQWPYCFRCWTWWRRPVERNRAVLVRTADFFRWRICGRWRNEESTVMFQTRHLARWLNRGGRLRTRANDPAYRRMRRKLRDPAGRAPVRQTQSHRRTSEWNIERAARHEEIPPARTGQSDRRVGAEQLPPLT